MCLCFADFLEGHGAVRTNAHRSIHAVVVWLVYPTGAGPRFCSSRRLQKHTGADAALLGNGTERQSLPRPAPGSPGITRTTGRLEKISRCYVNLNTRGRRFAMSPGHLFCLLSRKDLRITCRSTSEKRNTWPEVTESNKGVTKFSRWEISRFVLLMFYLGDKIAEYEMG